MKEKKAKVRKSTSVRKKIVIDEGKGLVFSKEDELYKHFAKEIEHFEKEFFSLRKEESDFDIKDFRNYENCLSQLLDDPMEVWEDNVSLPGQLVYNYIGKFGADEKEMYYVALVYLSNDTPTFVFLHFPTQDEGLVNHYRRGQIIFNQRLRELSPGAIEGDALSEGDELAFGLYQAMLKVRSEKDIAENDFAIFAQCREPSIEEPDELWRTQDYQGNVLVNFIKEFPDFEGKDIYYIVVTLEDAATSSHALLFSFPTVDKSLVDRYRRGENLHADEVVQEASH